MGLERQGFSVFRSALRPSGSALVEPFDFEESKKTTYCFNKTLAFHIMTFLSHMLIKPRRFMRAFRIALSMARVSNKGTLIHLAYLVEASSLLRIYKKNGIQHIHVHFGTNVTAIARLIHHLGGLSYSFTVHGPDEFDSAIAFDLHGKIKDAAFVIAISHFCSAQLKRWADFSDWDKIEIVHCSVGDDFFSEYSEITDDGPIGFACVGRLAPQKGQMILIKAFSELIKSGRDAHLTLVGDGELRKNIEEKIRTEQIENKISITGYVSEKEVRRHIKSSIALVMPSFAEGLPMVIMEAYAVGRPVISTFIAAIPELVKPRESGWLVPASDVAGLTNALIEVFDSDIKVLNDFAKAGKEITFRSHRTETEVASLATLFHKYIVDIKA